MSDKVYCIRCKYWSAPTTCRHPSFTAYYDDPIRDNKLVVYSDASANNVLNDCEKFDEASRIQRWHNKRALALYDSLSNW